MHQKIYIGFKLCVYHEKYSYDDDITEKAIVRLSITRSSYSSLTAQLSIKYLKRRCHISQYG